MKVLILILLTMLLATGCQTESGSGGDLVAGHHNVTNKFTVTNPPNKSYKAGTNLDFFLTFPYPVTVNTAGGTPRLTLTIGATTVYATYLLGTGTEELAFRYTVQPGETDTNGIAVASTIDLNGGALSFTGTAGLDDCNLAITVPSTANVRVDTTAPTIVTLAAPSNSTYYRNMVMSFVMTGSEALYVSGTPRVPFTVGATTRYATYASGSGTTALTFTYTVQDGDFDADGIAMISPVELNGGILRDIAYNNLALTYTPPASPNVLVDGDTPYVTSVNSPANGTYTYGQSMSFTLNFSEAVTVTGTPSILMTVGATPQSVVYASGSGSTALVFTYVVQGNDVDTNGVQLDTSIDDTGASILDVDSTAALTTFIAPTTPLVRISAAAPYITSFSYTTPKTWIIGETLTFTAIFNAAVTVNTAGGTPRIAIDVGGTTRYATYASGSGSANLVFNMPVVIGDLDTNGIAIQSPVDVNGGTIRGTATSIDIATSFSPPTTPNVRVDAIAPTITSVTNPANANYTTGVTTFNFTVNFSETVYVTSSTLVKLEVDIGGTTRQASYVSGSGSSALIFRYVPVGGDADADGVEVLSPMTVSGAGRIADQSAAGLGNTATYTFTPTASPSVTVNYGVPVVQSITPPSDGYYKLATNMDFTLVFSEAVTVAGTGPASFVLTVGATSRNVTYVSGSGTANLVFRYTTQAPDLDTNGVVAGTTLALNGATIRSVSTNTNASLTLPSQLLSAVLVDAVIPTISSVTAPSAATYIGGNFLDFTVNMSESVIVTGEPAIALDIGGNTVYATYTSGSPGSALIFRYTVQNGDVDLNGIGNSSPVVLDGGESITDVALNDATLTFSAPNTSAVLVQGTTPTITSVTPPTDGNYVAGAVWNFDLTMSEAATVNTAGCTPRIALTIGSTTRYATYASGSTTTTLRFTYTTQVGDDDSNGIAMGTSVDLQSGTIKNGATVDFSTSFTPPNTSLVRVDTSVPTITSVDGPANDTYGVGETLTFTVHTSEVVDVTTGTGGPRLQLTIGAATQYAVYTSGTGTDDLVFEYVVQTGDTDTDGIAVNTTLQLQTGTIKDAFLNNLAPLTFSAPNLTSVLVDAVAPTITSVTGPANGSYKAGANLDFTVNFSETVINGAGLQPRLQLTVGAATVYAMYQGGSNSNAWTFRYTVQGGDTDTNGIAVASPLQLNGATIKDANNNDLSPLTFAPPNLASVLVDTTAPSIVSVVNTSGNNTYTSGQTITFTVTFSEAVYVTNTPKLDITVGTTARTADYTAGSGTTTWTFVHSVVNGDYDNNGIVMASPLNLSGGAIADLATNASGLTFTPPTLTSVFIDAVLPVISSITVPGNAAYKNGTSMSFTLNMNKTITVAGGTPSMTLTVGGSSKTATYASGSGTQSLIFTYNPGNTDLDLDGIAVSGASLSLNGATMRDALLNNLDLTYPTIGSLTRVFVVYPAFQNWYDVDNSATVSFTNDGTGDAINTLTDIMGVNNLTASATARPYYFASGFGSANRGYMKFDGTNDIMSFAADPTVKSMIVVYRSNASTATTSNFILQTAGPGGSRKKIEPASGSALNLTVTGDYSVNGGAFSATNTTHTWAWAASTNYVLMVRWGASNTRATSFGSTTFNGRVAAVIILDDTSVALTGSEYTALATFLGTKYGVP